jgi:hypothetical protein
MGHDNLDWLGRGRAGGRAPQLPTDIGHAAGLEAVAHGVNDGEIRHVAVIGVVVGARQG